MEIENDEGENFVLVEKHTDILDIASSAQQEHMKHALHDHAKKMRRDQEPDKNGVYAILDCIECGDEIGEGRLAVAIKNTRCVRCVSLEERHFGYK